MSTNIVNDFQGELSAFQRFLQFLESMLLKQKEDIKAQLCKQLFEYVKANGDQSVNMKMFSPEHGKEIEKRLQAYMMPYTTFEDEKGNMVFLTRDCDNEKFLQIQNDYFLLQPDFYNQISPEQLCEIAKNEKQDLVAIQMHGENATRDLEVLKAKLFHHETGVVCAQSKTSDTLYIHPNNLYKSDGTDFSTAILRLAGENANEDQAALRLAQAEYDNNEIDLAILQLQEYNRIAIVDALNETNNYIYMEDNQLVLQCKSNDIGDFETKDSITLPDWKKPEEVAAFKQALSSMGTYIKNMRVIESSELNKHLNTNKNKLLETAYQSDIQKMNSFKYGKDNMDKNIYSIESEWKQIGLPDTKDVTELLTDKDIGSQIDTFIEMSEKANQDKQRISAKIGNNIYYSDTANKDYIYLKETTLNAYSYNYCKDFSKKSNKSLENVLKQFKQQYKDKIEQTYSKLDTEICLSESQFNTKAYNIGGVDENNKLNPNRPYRPNIYYSTATQFEQQGMAFYNGPLKSELGYLDKLAHEKVNKLESARTMSPQEKFQRVQQEMRFMMNEGKLDEIVKNNQLCPENIAQEIVNRVKQSYNDMVDGKTQNFTIETQKVKDVLEKQKQDIEQIQTKEHTQDNTKDIEPEMNNQ